MATPHPLRAWEDAPAIILSCPGPLRPHKAAITPVAELALPQCLLGYEAQLVAFAAAFPALGARMLFTPLPEMFSAPESLAALAPHLVGSSEPPVHLRFGSARAARIFKPARNGAVIAEDTAEAPVTTSLHPFASGHVLPAAMRRAFIYTAEAAPLVNTRGETVPLTLLPPACINADILRARAEPRAPDPQHPGLDLVSFAEFDSALWAAGPVRARSAHLPQVLREGQITGTPFVLLPWNLDAPGSIVPELLIRLVELQDPRRPLTRPLVLPYNYPGRLGLMRRLITRVRNAASDPEAVLRQIFVARLTRLESIPVLLRLAATAWVDGNDPESAWTLRRLRAAGIATILLDSGRAPPDAGTRIAAEEEIWIAAETRWGQLHFHAHIPARRDILRLLAETMRAHDPAPARRHA